MERYLYFLAVCDIMKKIFPPQRASEPVEAYTKAIPRAGVGNPFNASYRGMGIKELSIEILQRHLREVREHERITLMVQADPQILASHGKQPVTEGGVLNAIAVLKFERDPGIGDLLAEVAALSNFQSIRDAAMNALENRSP
jgi:hypothetical protein